MADFRSVGLRAMWPGCSTGTWQRAPARIASTEPYVHKLDEGLESVGLRAVWPGCSSGPWQCGHAWIATKKAPVWKPDDGLGCNATWGTKMATSATWVIRDSVCHLRFFKMAPAFQFHRNGIFVVSGSVAIFLRGAAFGLGIIKVTVAPTVKNACFKRCNT